MPNYTRSICWFRRDLRDYDHAAFYHALVQSTQVIAVFVFDREILDKLTDRTDRRVEFIWHSVKELQAALTHRGGGMLIAHDFARRAIPKLAKEFSAQAVFANHDYEPQAKDRDAQVSHALSALGIAFHTYKDQAIFERNEVLAQSGKPFSVFTPYKNAWHKTLTPFHLKAYPVEKYIAKLIPPPHYDSPSTLAELGFNKTNLNSIPILTGMSGGQKLFKDFQTRISSYHEIRDYPAKKGPSYLSVHLRFGTVSIRELAACVYTLAQHGSRGAETWLTELIWRDFYFMILDHHPHVVDHAFRTEYDQLNFPNDAQRFDAWCNAQTGYPLIDAAMRQINKTGYMHNRLRMVTASFLVKDLHIDWRWGERYFAQQLNDYDLAANNGGWQWAASTGCDAQPYFRIFNPLNQSEKFDPEGHFIRRYVPELAHLNGKQIHAPWLLSSAEQITAGVRVGHDYPLPIVDHAQSREITLRLYKIASA